MRYIKPFLLAALPLLFVNLAEAQGVNDFYQTCNGISLNTPFNKNTTQLIRDPDPYSLTSGSYRLACSLKSLYGLPIEKALLVAYEDTIQAITIFLPFDSTLLTRMENDLGPSTGAWMSMPAENIDTTKMIKDRRWFLDKFVVLFSCTRYMSLMGEASKDDRIKISLIRRRKQ